MADAESIDLESLDTKPTAAPVANTNNYCQAPVGQHNSYASSAAPQQLAYANKKKAGSMDELILEDDDGPIANTTGQTGMAPPANTNNYYHAPVHQPPPPQKKEYLTKKKHGSMDELDIDMDDVPVITEPNQTVTAMNQANSQVDPIFDAPAPGPLVPGPLIPSSTAPFIETSSGDLVPANTPVSPRSKLPRYNTEHWSGHGVPKVPSPSKTASSSSANKNNSAPMIDCSLDIADFDSNQSCTNPVNTDKPELLNDGSFEL